MSGPIYNPTNLPSTGTYLANQQFSITGLVSGTYSLGVYDPITNITHEVTLSAVRQPYRGPRLTINHITSEPVESNIQVNGARLIPTNDPDIGGFDPNGIYTETSTDQWHLDIGSSGAVIEYDVDSSRWLMTTTLHGVLIERSDMVPPTVKPWQAMWSDLDSSGTNMTVNLLFSGTNNTGGFSLTFNSDKNLTNGGVIMSLDYGGGAITKSAPRGTPIAFSDVDSMLVPNNNLTITDVADNRSWTLKVRVGYGTGLSYIQHNDNVLYQTGDTIIFRTDQQPSSKLIYQNSTFVEQDIMQLN